MKGDTIWSEYRSKLVTRSRVKSCESLIGELLSLKFTRSRREMRRAWADHPLGDGVVAVIALRHPAMKPTCRQSIRSVRISPIFASIVTHSLILTFIISGHRDWCLCSLVDRRRRKKLLRRRSNRRRTIKSQRSRKPKTTKTPSSCFPLFLSLVLIIHSWWRVDGAYVYSDGYLSISIKRVVLKSENNSRSLYRFKVRTYVLCNTRKLSQYPILLSFRCEVSPASKSFFVRSLLSSLFFSPLLTSLLSVLAVCSGQ